MDSWGIPLEAAGDVGESARRFSTTSVTPDLLGLGEGSKIPSIDGDQVVHCSWGLGDIFIGTGMLLFPLSVRGGAKGVVWRRSGGIACCVTPGGWFGLIPRRAAAGRGPSSSFASGSGFGGWVASGGVAVWVSRFVVVGLLLHLGIGGCWFEAATSVSAGFGRSNSLVIGPGLWSLCLRRDESSL